MYFSREWLNEWINVDLNDIELAHQITMAGLEVDGIEPAAPEFSGVVVGEIMEIEPHPDADKLRICQVAGNGDSLTQVVCGAANASKGLKIPFATVGAKLPNDFNIKEAKLRGVESFGMLCGASEIGLTDSGKGLMELAANAPVGTDIREYLSLDDTVTEVDLTPNRGDCLSIVGLAREVGVLNNTPLIKSIETEVNATLPDTFNVDIIDTNDCGQYACRIIKGVNPTATTPFYMQERLRRCGITPISPLVDVTNYVLLELGQPMHAFDLNKLSGGIAVRRGVTGEKLTLLDGKEIMLSDNELIIADNNNPQALAGIMGGEFSSISDSTTDILLESAFFNPITIAGRARKFGLHTDSSHRFERGVDSMLQIKALEYATQLIIEICEGEAGPIVTQGEEKAKTCISLSRENANKRIGIDFTPEFIEQCLTTLGCEYQGDGSTWMVTPPSWRFDFNIEEDLIEDLARIYGYDNIDGTMQGGASEIKALPEATNKLDQIHSTLVNRGYQEVISYSFVDRKLMETLEPNIKPKVLANPLSQDLSAMRTNLWVGLIKTAQHNINRQQSDLRIFETGLVYRVEHGELIQTPKIAGLLTGRLHPEHWGAESRNLDFFDAKGDIEALIGLTGQTVHFKRSNHPALHPGRSADIYVDNTLVGCLGEIHPQFEKQLSLGKAAQVFELDLTFIQTGTLPTYQSITKFPSIRRDLALISDANIDAATMCLCIKQASKKLLQDIVVFDIYQGQNIEPGKKSIALGLIFQDFSRTLDESDIQKELDSILSALTNELNISLRQ